MYFCCIVRQTVGDRDLHKLCEQLQDVAGGDPQAHVRRQGLVVVAALVVVVLVVVVVVVAVASLHQIHRAAGARSPRQAHAQGPHHTAGAAHTALRALRQGLSQLHAAQPPRLSAADARTARPARARREDRPAAQGGEQRVVRRRQPVRSPDRPGSCRKSRRRMCSYIFLSLNSNQQPINCAVLLCCCLLLY